MLWIGERNLTSDTKTAVDVTTTQTLYQLFPKCFGCYFVLKQKYTMLTKNTAGISSVYLITKQKMQMAARAPEFLFQ